MSRAYYNDVDPEAVAVLKELVASGVIPPGDVDGRSIKDVTIDDIRGYTQCHFFAGAGLWPIAARFAGWPDGRDLWSASCPCQGESLAGKRLGANDPRHLWPDLFRLARAGRPPILVGEQVAAAAGTHWLDRVCDDLESEGYAARAVDIPASAVDAPHQRNRLYWVAMAHTQEQRGRPGLREGREIGHWPVSADGDGRDFVLADAESIGGGREQPERRSEGRALDGRPDADGNLVDAAGERRGQGRAEPKLQRGRTTSPGADVREPSPLGDASRQRRAEAIGEPGNGEASHEQGTADRAQPAFGAYGRNGSWWADAEWIVCHDGKARRAKPRIPMLVDGMAGRASLWRLAGNSIVPQLAAEVLAAILEAERGMTDCHTISVLSKE